MEPLPGQTSRLVDVGGRRVRVVTGGAGEPSVFFDAALGTPLEEWALVAPSTSRQFHVVLWDRPGLGRSDAGSVVTGEPLVSSIAELLAVTCAGPAVVVGHSLGALHVLCVSLAHPELVAGLVLVEPSHPQQNSRLDHAHDPALTVAVALGKLPGAVTGGLGRLVAAAGAVLPLDQRTRATTALAPLVGRRLSAVADEHACTPSLFSYATDLLDGSSLGDLPVEVLTGGNNLADDAAARSEWRAMHAELAGLSSRGIHRIVDCGHDVPLAAPEAIREAIERVASASRI